METKLNLLEHFPQVTPDQWKSTAIQDLKGGDFDKQLVWKTYDNISIQPFYTKEDLPESLIPSPNSATRNWVNYAEIKVANAKEANTLARKLIGFDATGIMFLIKDSQFSDFDTLLKDIDLHQIHVSFKTEQPNPDLMRHYLCWCEGNDSVSMDLLKGFYECSILEKWTVSGGKPDFECLSQVLKLTEQTPGFKSFVVKSHAFVNSGCNTTQELAFLLNKVVEFVSQMSDHGIDPKSTLKDMLLHTAIGGDYFFEIAKLRALRSLFKSVAALYGVDNSGIQILASSSLWTKTIFDPNVNLLRNTTEAMSAVLGGCDALMIQPHDSSYSAPTEFSQRIALNVSNLLKEEAYLNKVVNPAEGSYYLENLTATLAQNALDLFKQIEAKGGFTKAFTDGVIQQAIAEVRTAREKDIVTKKKVIVGTNRYPNYETISLTQQEGKAGGDHKLLQPHRASEKFDALRLRTLKHQQESGFVPKVFLACFGNLAMRKARATFSAEFFGTAGFETSEHPFHSASEAAAKAAASEADIVVICSSDQDYETDAEQFAKTFKGISQDKFLILAGNPTELISKLESAGVDGFIHLKSNVIEVLSDFQNRLFETHKIS